MFIVGPLPTKFVALFDRAATGIYIDQKLALTTLWSGWFFIFRTT